jgi:hypothetical protein
MIGLPVDDPRTGRPGRGMFSRRAGALLTGLRLGNRSGSLVASEIEA